MANSKPSKTTSTVPSTVPSKPTTPSASEIPSSIGDYLVLPITLPSLPSLPPATHYLYLCRHKPKISTPDDGRSLFIVNCPVDATEAHFRRLFSEIGGGRVEGVRWEGEKEPLVVPTVVPAMEKEKGNGGKKRKRGGEGSGEEEGERELPGVWEREVRRSGGTALVVFVDRASCESSFEKVRRLGRRGKRVGWVWGEGVEGENVLGIARYLTHHALTFPPPTTLQPRIDAYITHFTRLEALRAQALARMRNHVDEDGFTMVVRGGRAAPAKMEEAQAVLEKKRKEEEEKRRGNVGFYRFQTREGKKEEARRLVERFEVDRRRVEERSGRGRFRPL